MFIGWIILLSRVPLRYAGGCARVKTGPDGLALAGVSRLPPLTGYPIHQSLPKAPIHQTFARNLSRVRERSVRANRWNFSTVGAQEFSCVPFCGTRRIPQSPKEEFMGKINWGRVVLGGIVAGIVADILDYLVDGIWLAPRWSHDMKALNHAATFSVSQMVWFDLIGIAGGLGAIWLYAAIRPRFGAGLKTAVYAGLATWFSPAFCPTPPSCT